MDRSTALYALFATCFFLACAHGPTPEVRDECCLAPPPPEPDPGTLLTAAMATRGDVKVTDFDDRIDIYSIAWSQDGSTLALTRGATSRDVVLLKGFR